MSKNRRNKIIRNIAFAVLPTSIVLGTVLPFMGQIHKDIQVNEIDTWQNNVKSINAYASLLQYAEETDNQTLINELESNSFAFSNLTLTSNIDNLAWLNYLKTNNSNGFAVQLPNAELANPNAVYSFKVSLSQINTSAASQLPPALQDKFLCLNSTISNKVILLIPAVEWNYYFSNVIPTTASQIAVSLNGYPLKCYATTISLTALQTVQQNYLTLGSYNAINNNSINFYDTVQLANIVNNYTLSANSSGEYGWEASQNGYLLNDATGDNALTLNYNLGSIALNSATLGELGFLDGLDDGYNGNNLFSSLNNGNTFLQNIFASSSPSDNPSYNDATQSSNSQVQFNAPLYPMATSSNATSSNADDTLSWNNIKNYQVIGGGSGAGGINSAINGDNSNEGLYGAVGGLQSSWDGTGTNPAYQYAQWLNSKNGTNRDDMNGLMGTNPNSIPNWWNSDPNSTWTRSTVANALKNAYNTSTLNSYSTPSTTLQFNWQLIVSLVAEAVSIIAITALYYTGTIEKGVAKGLIAMGMSLEGADWLPGAAAIANGLIIAGRSLKFTGTVSELSARASILGLMWSMHELAKYSVQYLGTSSDFDGTYAQALIDTIPDQGFWGFLKSLVYANVFLAGTPQVTSVKNLIKDLGVTQNVFGQIIANYFTGGTGIYADLSTYYTKLKDNIANNQSLFFKSSSIKYTNLYTNLDQLVFQAWENTYSSNNIAPISYVVQSSYIFTVNFIGTSSAANDLHYAQSITIGSMSATANNNASSTSSVSEIAWNSPMTLGGSTDLSSAFTIANESNYSNIVDLTPFTSSTTLTPESIAWEQYISPASFNSDLSTQGKNYNTSTSTSYQSTVNTYTTNTATNTYDYTDTAYLGLLGTSTDLNSITFSQLNTVMSAIKNIASSVIKSGELTVYSTNTLPSSDSSSSATAQATNYVLVPVNSSQSLQTLVSNQVKTYLTGNSSLNTFKQTLISGTTNAILGCFNNYIGDLLDPEPTTSSDSSSDSGSKTEASISLDASSSTPTYTTTSILNGFTNNFTSYWKNLWHSNVFNTAIYQVNSGTNSDFYENIASQLQDLYSTFCTKDVPTPSASQIEQYLTTAIQKQVTALGQKQTGTIWTQAEGMTQGGLAQPFVTAIDNFVTAFEKCINFATKFNSTDLGSQTISSLWTFMKSVYSSDLMTLLQDIQTYQNEGYLTKPASKTNSSQTEASIQLDTKTHTKSSATSPASSAYPTSVSYSNIYTALNDLITDYDGALSLPATSSSKNTQSIASILNHTSQSISLSISSLINIAIGVSNSKSNYGVYGSSYYANLTGNEVKQEIANAQKNGNYNVYSQYTTSILNQIDEELSTSNTATAIADIDTLINDVSKNYNSTIASDLLSLSGNNKINPAYTSLYDWLTETLKPTSSTSSELVQGTYNITYSSISQMFQGVKSIAQPSSNFSSSSYSYHPTAPNTKSPSQPSTKSSKQKSASIPVPTYLNPFNHSSFTYQVSTSLQLKANTTTTTTQTKTINYSSNVQQNINDFDPAFKTWNNFLQASTSTGATMKEDGLGIYINTGTITSTSPNGFNIFNNYLANVTSNGVALSSYTPNETIFNASLFANPSQTAKLNQVYTIHSASPSGSNDDYSITQLVNKVVPNPNLYAATENANISSIITSTQSSPVTKNQADAIVKNENDTTSQTPNTDPSNISNLTVYFALGSNAPIILDRTTGQGVFSPSLENSISPDLYANLKQGLALSGSTVTPLYFQNINLGTSTTVSNWANFANASESGYLSSGYLSSSTNSSKSNTFNGYVYNVSNIWGHNDATMQNIADNSSVSAQNLYVLNFGANTFNNYTVMTNNLTMNNSSINLQDATTNNSNLDLFSGSTDFKVTTSNFSNFWYSAYNTTKQASTQEAVTPNTEPSQASSTYSNGQSVQNNFNFCYSQYYTYNNANIGSMTDAINLHPLVNDETQPTTTYPSETGGATGSTPDPTEAVTGAGSGNNDNWYDYNTLYVTNAAGNISSMISALNDITINITNPFSNLGSNDGTNSGINDYNTNVSGYTNYISTTLKDYLDLSNQNKTLNTYANINNYITTSSQTAETTWKQGPVNYIYNSSINDETKNSYTLIAYAPQLTIGDVLSVIGNLYDASYSKNTINVTLNQNLSNNINDTLQNKTWLDEIKYNPYIYLNNKPITTQTLPSIAQNPYFASATDTDWQNYLETAIASFIANNKIVVNAISQESLSNKSINGTLTKSENGYPQNINLPISLSYSSANFNNQTYTPIKQTCASFSDALSSTNTQTTILFSGQTLFNELLSKNFTTALSFLTTPLYLQLSFVTSLYNENESSYINALTPKNNSSNDVFTNGTNNEASTVALSQNAASVYVPGVVYNSTAYNGTNNLIWNFNDIKDYIQDSLLDGNDIESKGFVQAPWGVLGLIRQNQVSLINNSNSQTWTTNTVLGADIINDISFSSSISLANLITLNGKAITSKLLSSTINQATNSLINYLALKQNYLPLNVQDEQPISLASVPGYTMSSVLNNTQTEFDNEVSLLYNTISASSNSTISKLLNINFNQLSSYLNSQATSTDIFNDLGSIKEKLVFNYENLTNILSIAATYLNILLQTDTTNLKPLQTINGNTYNIFNLSDIDATNSKFSGTISNFVSKFPLLSSYMAQLLTAYNPGTTIDYFTTLTTKQHPTENPAISTASLSTIITYIITQNIIYQNNVQSVLLNINKTQEALQNKLNPKNTSTPSTNQTAINGSLQTFSYVYNQLTLPMNYTYTTLNYSQDLASSANYPASSVSKPQEVATYYVPTNFYNEQNILYPQYSLSLLLTQNELNTLNNYKTVYEDLSDVPNSLPSFASWMVFDNIYTLTTTSVQSSNNTSNGMTYGQATVSNTVYNNAYYFNEDTQQGTTGFNFGSTLFNNNPLAFNLLNGSLSGTVSGSTTTYTFPIYNINMYADSSALNAYSTNWLLNALYSNSTSNATNYKQLIANTETNLNTVLDSSFTNNSANINFINAITGLVQENSTLGWLQDYAETVPAGNIFNSSSILASSTLYTTNTIQVTNNVTYTVPTLNLTTNSNNQDDTASLASNYNIFESLAIEEPSNSSILADTTYTPTKITLATNNNLTNINNWQETTNSVSYLLSARELSNITSQIVYNLVANELNDNSARTILSNNPTALHTIFSAMPLLALNTVINNRTLNTVLSSIANGNDTTLQTNSNLISTTALELVLTALFSYGLINASNGDNEPASNVASNGNLTFLPIRNIIQYDTTANGNTHLTAQKALSSIEGSVAYNNLYGALSYPQTINKANNEHTNIANYYASMSAWYSSVAPYTNFYSYSFKAIFNNNDDAQLSFPSASGGVSANDILNDYNVTYSKNLQTFANSLSSVGSVSNNYLQWTNTINNQTYYTQTSQEQADYTANNLLAMASYSNATVWSPLSFINMDNSWNLGITYTSYSKDYAISSDSINYNSYKTSEILANTVQQAILPFSNDNDSNIDLTNASWVSVTAPFPDENTTLASLNQNFATNSQTYYSYAGLSNLLSNVIVNFNAGNSTTNGLLFDLNGNANYSSLITVNTYLTNQPLITTNNLPTSNIPSNATLQNSSSYEVKSNGNYFYLQQSTASTLQAPYSLNFVYNTKTSTVGVYLLVNNALNLYNANLANIVNNKLDSLFSYFNNASSPLIQTLGEFLAIPDNLITTNPVSSNYNGNGIALGVLNFNNYLNGSNTYTFGSLLNANDDTFSKNQTPQELLNSIENKLIYNFGTSKNYYTIASYEPNNNLYYGYFEIAANANTMFYNQLQNLYNNVLASSINSNDASFVNADSINDIANSFFNPTNNTLYNYDSNFAHTGVLSPGDWSIIRTENANGTINYSIVWNLNSYAIPLQELKNMQQANNDNKNLSALGALAIVPVIVALAVAGWWLYRRKKQSAIRKNGVLDDTFSTTAGTGYSYSINASAKNEPASNNNLENQERPQPAKQEINEQQQPSNKTTKQNEGGQNRSATNTPSSKNNEPTNKITDETWD